MKKALLAAVMVLQLAPLPLLNAQVDERAQGEEADEGPGRAVARISVVSGDVSVRQSDSGDLVAAVINAPVTISDSVLTGPGARAEVQLDYANLLRLAADSDVRFSELENGRFQLQIARGTITYSVLRDTKADIDLSTPNVSVRPSRKGRYRMTVMEDGTTEISVRSGEAEIFTPRGTETLRAGKTMAVRGTASDPEYQLGSTRPADEWDRWNEDRDKELGRSDAYRYVSTDVPGAEDLGPYGRWVYAPEYGWVWSPQVAAGWAPYQSGRWSWVDWYGWTWVSYDPWGWAPYHYGRWFYHGPYGWCWWPGGFTHHYWRPALVAFFGWGGYSGVSVGVGFGYNHIGWVPLAPHERYVPWYGRRYYDGYRNHGTYINNNVTIVNNTNITNVYRNAQIRTGITAVNGADFGRGRVSNIYRGSTEELRRVDLVRGQLPVTPHRESLAWSDRQASNVVPPASRGQFASRRQVTAPDKVPFAEQQQGMEQTTRRIFSQEGNPRMGARGGSAVAAESPNVFTANPGGSPNPGGVMGAERSGRGVRADAGNPRGGEAVSTLPDRGVAGPNQDSGSVIDRSRGSRGWRRADETPSANQSTSVPGAAGTPGVERNADPGRSGMEGQGRVGRGPTETHSTANGGNSGSAERSRGGVWQRFGEPSRSDMPRSQASDPTPSSPAIYRSTPRSESRSNRSDTFGGGFGEPSVRGSESIPSRPPIVRDRMERSNLRPQRYESMGGGNNGSSSAGRVFQSPGGGQSGGGRSAEAGGAARPAGGGGGGGGGGDHSGGSSSRSSVGGGGRSGRGR